MMTTQASGIFSRSARLAADLAGRTEEDCASLFAQKRVLVSLESEFATGRDTRETFLLAVNHILRFCPNIGLFLPSEGGELAARCRELVEAVHGDAGLIRIVNSEAEFAQYDAIVNIGTKVRNDLPWITVNSSGWVARIACSQSRLTVLPWAHAANNACGSLAAACLGAGAAFMAVLGHFPKWAQEISLLDHRQSAPGILESGPALPSNPMMLNAFLVGCGAVSNGWAYTIKRLPIHGALEAIDRQRLRAENLGPYILAHRDDVDEMTKAQMIADVLAPAIKVNPRPEEWELFKIRLRLGLLHLPKLVVNGLDHVGTRHSVQRLWPETLIDMGAGGLTTQVIVKQFASNDLCLLRALDIPPGEVEWAERLALETGLSAERIRNEAVTDITQDDIDAADSEFRAHLERFRGKPICGRVTEQNLRMEGQNPGFAPAVPFVTAFSGIVGAAETLKCLMGLSSGVHYQRNFQSSRSRALKIECDPACECRSARGIAA